MVEQEKLRVLLADDDPLIRSALASVMANEPSIENVIAVENGEHVLVALCADHFDIGLLDVEMPGMGGLTAAKEIARRFPEVKTVMLTSFPYPDFLERALVAGARGFLTKDTEVDVIVQMLHRVMNGEQPVSPEPQKFIVEDYRKTAKSRERFAQFVSAIEALEARYQPLLSTLAQGYSNKKIAEAVYLSEKTVRHYVSEILERTGCDSRTEFAFKALETRCVQLSYDD